MSETPCTLVVVGALAPTYPLFASTTGPVLVWSLTTGKMFSKKLGCLISGFFSTVSPFACIRFNNDAYSHHLILLHGEAHCLQTPFTFRLTVCCLVWEKGHKLCLSAPILYFSVSALSVTSMFLDLLVSTLQHDFSTDDKRDWLIWPEPSLYCLHSSFYGCPYFCQWCTSLWYWRHQAFHQKWPTSIPDRC